MILIKKSIHILGALCCSLQMMLASNVYAAEAEKEVSSEQFNLKELALPSDVKDIAKKSGAIYFSPAVKGKVLMPVHFWGEVTNAGLHFVPVETDLVQGLSLAGGANTSGRMDNIKVVRRQEKNSLKEYEFDLTEGGNQAAYAYVLSPGDTVFVEKSRFYEDRLYYTSLIGVIATVLSSILLYREVRRNN